MSISSHWKTVPLKNLCTIITGKKDVNSGNPDGKYRFYTCARNFTYSDDYSYDFEAILIAGNGDVGHCSYYKGKFEAYQRTYILKDFNKSLIDVGYLFFVLNGTLKDVVSRQKLGNTMPYIKVGMLSEFSVAVPPIEEQREIVALLDSAFAKIDDALANVRQNIINSNELFQSKLTQIFSNYEPNWNTSSLMDACLKITDGSHFSPKDTEYNEYPYITVRDISNNIINFEDCKTIKEVDYLDLVKNNCKPQKGDVLFSKDGTVGKVSLIDYEKDFVVLSSLAIIRPKQEIVLPELLKWILLDPKFVKEAVGKKTGTAIRRIILKNLKEITIRYPKDLKSQRELVERIGSLEEFTKLISKKYKTEEVSLLELKKSLLQKAFSGELTAKKV